MVTWKPKAAGPIVAEIIQGLSPETKAALLDALDEARVCHSGARLKRHQVVATGKAIDALDDLLLVTQLECGAHILNSRGEHVARELLKRNVVSKEGTKTSKRERGTCTHCGQKASLVPAWFGESVLEFHGQRGSGMRGRGILGRCRGSRLPPAEVGAERLAAYIEANDARVASYSAE